MKARNFSRIAFLGLAFLVNFRQPSGLFGEIKNALDVPDRALLDTLNGVKQGEAKVRRADVIFFIALPFTILYGTLLTLVLDQAVALKASIEKNALYFGLLSGPAFPEGKQIDSNILFIAINGILWSGAIAHNDFYEGLFENNRAMLKERFDEARVSLNFLRTYF